MSEKGKLKEYLDLFYKRVIEKTVKEHKEVIEVVPVAAYPIQRETWCIFIHLPKMILKNSTLMLYMIFRVCLVINAKFFILNIKNQD